MPNSAFYYNEDDGRRVYPDEILYLNVTRDPDTRMNCTVFVVGGDDLRAMKGREWIYAGVDVTSDLRGLRVVGGQALIFAAMPEHTVRSVPDRSEVALRRSYVRMLDAVVEGTESAVQEAYVATTDPIPRHLLIDDSFDASRPNRWEVAGHDFRPESEFGVAD
jgi:hypothetical protein